MMDPEENVPRADLLVIDDTPENLRLLTVLLSNRGYKIRAAASGQHGLAAALARTPDLILLDVKMPDMDGYEVCRRLKEDERTRAVPVLFLSALDDVQDKLRGFDAGGVDYVTKPFQWRELVARVDTHLELCRLQSSLRDQIVERDRLIDELEAFTHTVAHDLKSPLTGLTAYADYLHDHGDEMTGVEIGEFSAGIFQLSHKLAEIVDGLLLLSSARHRKVLLEALDMTELIAQALRRLQPDIMARQAIITQPLSLPAAMGYGPWIEEVWTNYISNAIKYGGAAAGEDNVAPHIELGAIAHGDMVRFWVCDDGPGITSEEQSALFVPFSRLTDLRPGGHGLGLSIVERIVHRLGGEVGVDSEPGQGSTFWFTLPAAPESTDTQRPESRL